MDKLDFLNSLSSEQSKVVNDILEEEIASSNQALLQKVRKLVNYHTVGIASIHGENTDPNSPYNRGLRDGTNQTNAHLRTKLDELESGI